MRYRLSQSRERQWECVKEVLLGEVRTYRRSTRASNGNPLPSQPTLGNFGSALQDDIVVLQPCLEIVPSGGNEFVFSLEIDNLLLSRGVLIVMVSSQARYQKMETIPKPLTAGWHSSLLFPSLV